MSNIDQQTFLAIPAINTYPNGTMFVLGTIGNVMNIILFCCLKSYRSLVTSTFLATSSFAGQLYLTFSLGLESLSNWIGYDIVSRNPGICKSTWYIKNVGIQVSLTCLCLSSIDRYFMTSRSARQRGLLTLKRARLIIGICFAVWICAEIPYALYSRNIPILNLCLPSYTFASVVTYLNLVLGIFLPVTIMSVFGFLTWKNLGNTRLNALNSQVTKMILLDIIVVALSNIPLGSFSIYAVVNSANRLYTPTETLLVILVQLFSTIQIFGSFYFYLAVSPAFRTNLKKMLRDIICFWKPRIMNQIAPSSRMFIAQPIVTAGSKIVDTAV